MPNDTTQPITAYVSDEEAGKLLTSIDDMPVKLRRLHRLVRQLLDERVTHLAAIAELERKVNYLQAVSKWTPDDSTYNGESVDTPEQMKDKAKPKGRPGLRPWRGWRQ